MPFEPVQEMGRLLLVFGFVFVPVQVGGLDDSAIFA